MCSSIPKSWLMDTTASNSTKAASVWRDSQQLFRVLAPFVLSISMNAVSCAQWKPRDGMPGFCSTKSIIWMGRCTSTVCTPARSLLWTIGQSSGRPSPAKLGKTNCWDTHFGGIPEESYVLASWAQRHFGITLRKRFAAADAPSQGAKPEFSAVLWNSRSRGTWESAPAHQG
jgi:hypothetical protein